MITQKAINEQIIKNLNALEANTRYRINREAANKVNEFRNKNGYSNFDFSRLVFERDKKNNIKFFIDNREKYSCRSQELNVFTFSSSFFASFFAFDRFIAFAFLENNIEKVHHDNCDGKEVEIDGQTYILKLKD